MNKSELIKLVAEELGFTQGDTEQVINYAFDTVGKAIKTEGRVAIHGFGIFKQVHRKASTRPNPQDRNKTVQVPARTSVGFKPAPELKRYLNE